jgi:RNA polymerase sigma-70 factor, ECF subfamily
MANEIERMWHEFHDRLRGFIARRVNDPGDVEDILQEVFLRIHQHVRTVRDTDRLVSWVFQITRNAIVDYYRASAQRSEIPVGTTVELASREPTPTDEILFPNNDPAAPEREIATCLAPMIDRLAPRYREAIKLVEIDGLTQRAAAERIGISISGMKSRVQRGRHKLQQMLRTCCELHFDQVGNISNYEVRDSTCQRCGCSQQAAPI